jgi:hypothetical protein
MHVKRRDLALGWVPALAERLFFFHPLAHIAAREYLTAREAACDAAVVRALDVPADDYGRLLVRLGVGGASAMPMLAADSSSPSMSSLRRRLHMLQHLSGPHSRRTALAIAAVMIVLLIPIQLVARRLVTPPYPQVSSPQPVEPVEPAREVVVPQQPAAAEPADERQVPEASTPQAEFARALAGIEAARRRQPAVDEQQILAVQAQLEQLYREVEQGRAEAIGQRSAEAQRNEAEAIERARRTLAELEQRYAEQQQRYAQEQKRASTSTEEFLRIQLADLAAQQARLQEQLLIITRQQQALAEAQRDLAVQAERIREAVGKIRVVR